MSPTRVLQYMIFACLLHPGADSFAQSSTVNPQLDFHEQQRTAAERARQQEKLLSRPMTVREEVADSHPDAGLLLNEKPCFTIRHLEFSGDETGSFLWLLPRITAEQQPANNPINKCLGIKGISRVAKNVQNALIRKGYITTRVLTQPQNISSGKLILTIIPGRINKIKITNPEASPALWNALPFSEGDLLNIRDIEQAVENFERNLSVNADIKIIPAAEDRNIPGQSDLLISFRKNRSVRGSLFADDSGSLSTGRYQISLNTSWENPLRINDTVTVSLSRTLKKWSPEGSHVGSHSLHYSLPLGYWKIALDTSQNQYQQKIAGASQDYFYKGESRQNQVKLSRTVQRNANSRTEVSFTGFQRKSRNFINDAEVKPQRRRTGGWKLGIGYQIQNRSSNFNFGINYIRGTGAFGATPAPEQLFDEGTARFELVKANAYYRKQFTAGKQRFYYSANWRAQWHHTALTPQDRFSIGNRYTVRGFDGERTLSSDRGWFLQNEIGLNLLSPHHTLYFGLDHGRVGGPSARSLAGRKLTGAVWGIRGKFNSFQYNLFWGSPVSEPERFSESDSTVGFNAGITF